jgi:hypothetical protein
MASPEPFEPAPAGRRLGVVLSYCSLERPFLARCLREALLFADRVAVAHGSRLHDGVTPEPELPPGLPADPRVAFVRYEVDGPRPPDYYLHIARAEGFRAVRDHVDWVLFLDADEICEGERMRRFARDADLDPRLGYKLAMYWYFRAADLQSLVYEDSAVLVHRDVVGDPSRLLDCPLDRDTVVDWAPGGVVRFVADGARVPMLHHYSWVRETPEALLCKVRVWGHREQRDWATMLRAELARPVVGDAHTDVVVGKSYRRVREPFFTLT